VTQDPEEALERRPDAVLVCTPPATHLSIVDKALDTGAHVFVEKPLSTTLDGVEALLKKVRATGRVVQVGYNLRYHPALKTMKAIVESGRLGAILGAHAEFGLYLPSWWPGRDYRESYLVDHRLSGGLLLDASHEIDVLVWLLGPVEDVIASGAKLSTLECDGPDVIRAVLKMASGALASVHVDCLQPTYTRRYMVMGEGTALRWDCPEGRADSHLGRLEVCDRASSRFQRVAVSGRARDTYVDELRDFLASVTSGHPPAVGVEHGMEVLRVCVAIQEAMERRCAVPLPAMSWPMAGMRA
jgi:predicted dehydrogenase